MLYDEPIFLQPVFQERIWGGQKLKSEFYYDIPNKKIGEAWVISAHSNGPSVIRNGPLQGKTMEYAWKEHGELFNKKPGSEEDYPLLVKIIDANDDLSVQVHPDDRYAQLIEGVSFGKTECWYVLSAEEGTEIILGHCAKTREELEYMIDNSEWDKLLKRVKVRPGDFYYVPSGTIHAIGKGIVILETQQSSDITYRVYDYDRTDVRGNKRELHLNRAKEVTVVPHQPAKTEQMVDEVEGLIIKRLVKEKYFTVYHWGLDGEVTQKLEHNFLQVSVIQGSGVITLSGKDLSLTKGDHFILPHQIEEYKISGKMEFIVSHP